MPGGGPSKASAPKSQDTVHAAEVPRSTCGRNVDEEVKSCVRTDKMDELISIFLRICHP